MVATKQNILLEQGTTIHFEIPLYDGNNNILLVATGLSAEAQIRESWEDANAFSFVTSFSTDANTGQIILDLDMDANTSGTIEPGNYVYDVKLSTANASIRLMEGVVNVTPEISR